MSAVAEIEKTEVIKDELPPKPKAPAHEAFSKDLEEFGKMFKESQEKEKAKPKEKEKAAGETEKADDKKKADKPKEEKKPEDKKPEVEKTDEEEEEAPAPRRPRKPARTDDEVAELAAKTAARTVEKLTERKEPTKTVDDSDLPEDVQYRLEVYGELESSNAKHKGISDRYRKWVRELDSYQRKWEAEHPGETFDEDAADHNTIFEREPEVSEREYDRARVRLARRGEEGDEVKKLETEHKKLKVSVVEQKLEPVIDREATRAVSRVLGSIDEAYAKALDTPDGLKKLAEEDPIAAGITGHVASEAVPFIREVVRLYDSDGEIAYDEKNPLHKGIVDFATRMERATLAKPQSKQMAGGKAYLPMAEWAALPEAERQHYWSFADRNVLINFRISMAIHEASELLKQEEGKAKAYEKRFGKRNGALAEKAEKPKVEEEAAVTEKPDEDEESPSGAARGTVVAPPTETRKSGNKMEENFLRLLHGGR